MEQILEADANGVIVLSPETGAPIKPHARYALQEENGKMTLTPQEEKPFWATATPDEWVANFRQWMARIREESDGRPPLPEEALHRESMYD